MADRKTGFGTFGGVFVPNILTILGVIMYLRLGWVVGNAGLRDTLVILLVANLITLLSAVSISIISTNMNVRVGGVYYMISRSLGQEAGGSIGIPLYLAQALGIGLYVVGFTESVNRLFPDLDPLMIRLSTLTVLAVLALISSRIVIKVQYIILSVVAISIASFFLGKAPDFSAMHLSSEYSAGYDFWSVFAVFFPAVTGILSGVSMSGDLRDPAKSIPRGTLISVLTGGIVYLLMAVWFSVTARPEELIADNTVIISIARWAPLIYAGIWGATLSSALASLLAAPRTMQALGKDGILFRVMGRGRGRQNEPLIATLATFLIVAFVMYIGDLNSIAPILTMFFLITYGSVNIIAFIESIIRRPGFRPTFKAHWIFPLLGAIGCLWVMFVINILACILGFSFVIILYLLLKRAQIQRNWGDVRIGIWSAVIQYSFLKLKEARYHPRNWRPNILLLGDGKIIREQLLKIAAALTRRSGFISIINIYPEGETDPDTMKRNDHELQEYLKKTKITAFHRNIKGTKNKSSKMIAVQTHGFGEYTHNTAIMEWPEMEQSSLLGKNKELKEQFELVRFNNEMNISSILINTKKEHYDLGYSKIDLWWDPEQDNGSFMLLLAHLIATGIAKETAKITIKTVVLGEKASSTRLLLEELIKKSRIRANIHVIYPAASQQKSLEIKYNRILKAKKRKRELLNIFKRIRPGKQEGSAEDTDREEIRDEKREHEEENSMDEKIEEEGLKKQLKSLVEEKDAFIIKKSIQEIIIENSREADLVMLGYKIPDEEREQKYLEKMNELIMNLPDTILINCPFEVNLFE